MLYVVGSTNRTGISISSKGYTRPLQLAGIDFEFIPYSQFLYNIHEFRGDRCLIVPIPSAWSFDLNEKTLFTSVFVCESNTIPQRDRDKLQYMEDIWTPSTFCSKILKHHNIDSKLIPYSIETPKRPRIITQQYFTFMCSFDGKFTYYRKGILKAIEAFKSAFSFNPNIRLVIKTFDLKLPTYKELQRAIMGDSRITINSTFVEHTDEIYDNIDCYVSLHSAEGFGMHIAEAMYREVPVITTNYGGNTDFCNIYSSFLVNGEFIDHSYDPQYSWNGVWVEPDITQAAAIMKFVVENYNVAIEKARFGKTLVTNLYSDKAIANLLKQRI